MLSLHIFHMKDMSKLNVLEVCLLHLPENKYDLCLLLLSNFRGTCTLTFHCDFKAVLFSSQIISPLGEPRVKILHMPTKVSYHILVTSHTALQLEACTANLRSNFS